MLPSVNSKSFLECDLNDIQTILDNTDFKESEYLDYKKSFELTEIPKTQKDALDKAKAEFRKDVCAFANAQGGYLIYGIKEDGKGVPHEVAGITIADNNTDAFENLVKNALQTITPRIPQLEIRYVALDEGKYLVIVYIPHDFFAPYVFIENNQDYRIYKRVGNSIRVITYQELKIMFSQSITLENEITKYRKERINHFYDQEAAYHEEQFMLLHLIPETFLDSSYNKPIYYQYRKGRAFNKIFAPFRCSGRPIPIVAGIRYDDKEHGTECRLQNSGIAEVYLPLKTYIEYGDKYPNGFLFVLEIWEKIEQCIRSYAQETVLTASAARMYAGVSIVGCKNVITDNNWPDLGSIDRHILICEPVLFESMAGMQQLEYGLKRLELETLLSLGIHSFREIKQLLAEVYE